MISTIFRGGNHAFIEWKGGKEYLTIKRAIQQRDYLEHLNGKTPIGVIPIDRNNLSSWGALDIDTHHKGKKEDIKKLCNKINFLGLPLTAAESKSGGVHLYLMLHQKEKAKDVIHMLQKFRYALGYDENNCEIFPKQSELKPGENGNGINLPCYGSERLIYDSEGNKLPPTVGLEFLSKRIIKLKECEPYKLLHQGTSNKNVKSKTQHRNDRTWCAATYIKKFHPEDWQNKVREYDDLFNETTLKSEGNRLENTIIKSNERRDYFDPNLEEKIVELKSYCINDFIKLDIPKPKFITKKLIREKSINFIGGPKGRGKTEFCLGMSYAAVHGKDFLKWKVEENYPVHYVDGEMDPTDIWEREIKYRERFGAPPPNYFKILNYQTANKDNYLPDLRNEDEQQLYLDQFELQYKQTGKKPLIFFDNLRSLSSYNENSSDEYNPINKFFLKLKALGYSIIVVDHTGKDKKGYRGTSSKTDNAYVCLLLDPEENKYKIVFTLRYDKARGLRPEETDDYTVGYEFNGQWTEAQSVKQKEADSTKSQIRELQKKNMTQKAIAKELDLSVGKINKLIQEIAEDDKKSSII